MKVIDITRTLTPEIAVWPGDQPFAHTWTLRIPEGDTVNLSAVQMSLHTGTHVDAPLHYQNDGKPLDELPLLQFIGPCLVIDTTQAGAISPQHVEGNDRSRIPRLLFKTRHSGVPDTVWDPDLVPFTVATVERMAQQGVVLIGTDAPSVDPADSKTLEAHHAMAAHGITNIEGLQLSHVAPGRYQLIALPMKIYGVDGAPLRAVLVQE